jgi:hypothetical protein
MVWMFALGGLLSIVEALEGVSERRATLAVLNTGMASKRVGGKGEEKRKKQRAAVGPLLDVQQGFSTTTTGLLGLEINLRLNSALCQRDRIHCILPRPLRDLPNFAPGKDLEGCACFILVSPTPISESTFPCICRNKFHCLPGPVLHREGSYTE